MLSGIISLSYYHTRGSLGKIKNLRKGNMLITICGQLLSAAEVEII